MGINKRNYNGKELQNPSSRNDSYDPLVEQSRDSIGRDLSRLLKPEPSLPVDRRAFLSLLGSIGFVATTGFSISRAAKPMPTIEMESEFYVPSPEVDRVLRLAITDCDNLISQTANFLNRHQELFNRRVTVEWEEQHTRMVEQCSGTGDTRTCWQVPETYWSPASDSETVYMDQYLSSGDRQDTIGAYSDAYRQFKSALSSFNRRGLQQVDYKPADIIDSEEVSDQEFAEHYGFEWQDGKVSSFAKTAIATLVGVPMTAFGIFYNQIAEHISGRTHFRSSYNDDVNEYMSHAADVKSTRRAFIAAVAGLGVGTLMTTLNNKAQVKDSEEIVSEGRGEIEELVERLQTLTPDQIFEEYAGMPKAQLIALMNRQIVALESVDLASVSNAVNLGLQELNRAEDRCRPTFFSNVRFVRTTRKDSQNNPAEISAYVAAARSLANQIRAIKTELEQLFASDFVDTIHPSMRAAWITDKTSQVESAQKRAHLAGLAWDMSKMYGAIFAVMIASEASSQLDEKTYTVIQRTFDAIDRAKMGTYEVFLNLKESTKGHLKNLNRDTVIKDKVSSVLASLTDTFEAYIEAEQVNPDTQTGQNSLQSQISNLKSEEIVKLYWEKALTFFTNQQMKASGTLQSFFKNRALGDDAVVDPTYQELQAKIVELIQRANDRNLIFFDLLHAGLLQDGYSDRSYLEAVPSKLEVMIRNKAERAANLFKSDQDDLVALGLLPHDWAMPELDSNAKTLTVDDFVRSAEKLALSQAGTAEQEVLIQQIRRVHGEMLSEQEVARYLILQVLDTYLEVGADIDALLMQIPAYQEALSQVSETVSA